MRRSDSFPPIFILSYERSGSTLLRYIVDTHPDICSPGELHLGRYCQELAHIIDLLSLGKRAANGASDDKAQRVNAAVGQMVREVMDRYARSKGKRRWCEKTPSNLDFLELLSSIFPDAKYLCLHRNCMDVVHSCLQKPGLGLHVSVKYFGNEVPSSLGRIVKNKTAMFADHWVYRTRNLLAFEQEHPDQCFRIKYESLVADPQAVLQPMFTFLGVEWNQSLLDEVFKAKHDPGPGDTKIMFLNQISTDNIGKGAAIARKRIPKAILQQVNEVLGELDYPVVGPDWDSSPPTYLETVPQRQKQVGAKIGIEEVFTRHFPRRLKDRGNSLKGAGETYKFVVTGEDPGVWLIDMSKPDGQIREEDSEASCTITISTNDLVAIVNGELNPGLAFDQGKVMIAGDVRQAIGIGQLLLSA